MQAFGLWQSFPTHFSAEKLWNRPHIFLLDDSQYTCKGCKGAIRSRQTTECGSSEPDMLFPSMTDSRQGKLVIRTIRLNCGSWTLRSYTALFKRTKDLHQNLQIRPYRPKRRFLWNNFRKALQRSNVTWENAPITTVIATASWTRSASTAEARTAPTAWTFRAETSANGTRFKRCAVM